MQHVARNRTFPIQETAACSGLMRRRCLQFHVYTTQRGCKQPCLTLHATALRSVNTPLRNVTLFTAKSRGVAYLREAIESLVTSRILLLHKDT